MLSAKRLGIAGGILWGATMFIITLANIWFGYAAMWLELMTSIYPGFEVSYVGSIIGLIYGFIDGFVGLFLLAWLYNRVGE
ncbi:MAG: bacteriophage holin [Chlamydiota bacterium]